MMISKNKRNYVSKGARISTFKIVTVSIVCSYFVVVVVVFAVKD
jgi:hypothetical protein